jgi:hypothetical protein
VLAGGMLIVDHLLPYRNQQRNWLAAVAPMYFAYLAMTILNGIWKNAYSMKYRNPLSAAKTALCFCLNTVCPTLARHMKTA